MVKLTTDATVFDEMNINVSVIRNLIDTHYASLERLITNKSYFEGMHKITFRKKSFSGSSNEKIVCNHARDIILTSTGYFLNKPIQYLSYDNENENQVALLQEKLDIMNVDDIDIELAEDIAICGVGYEYIYAREDETELSSRTLSPLNTFLVYDDTIEENLLFGVYYYRYKDVIYNTECYRATVCTKNYIHNLILECSGQHRHRTTQEPRPHYLNDVPIIEYLNNRDGIGDFEQQISLIDAYNTLMSDRINDKVQFVESLLVIYGSNFGDDNEEVSQAMKVLKENGLLEMPNDSKVEYISRTFNENELETLRKAIKEDIYTFSHVPNLTDNAFGGNVSGVAMEYKLLGLNQIINTKQRYFIKGLKRRIQLIANYLGLKQLVINPNNIKIQFTRELPKNMQELANMIATLKGTVSSITLLSQLPFVEDAKSEVERVNEENVENILQQQKLFASDYNTAFNEELNNEEDTTTDSEDDEQDIN